MRLVFKVIIFIFILVVAGLIALPFVVNPNDYKQQISEQVEKATGRQLTLEGDIELSVFPWIALELGPLSLSNAKGFQADSFAQVDTAEVRIKLMPLLNKQLEMDTVILDGLVLNLEKNKTGKTNWDDFAGSGETATNNKTEVKPEPSTHEAPALAAITIAGVQLTNANIMWADASAQQNIKLQNVNLSTEPLSPGKPTAVAMEFDILSTKPQATVHVTLNSKISVDLENQQYALSNLNFATQANGKNLPFTDADITLSADINADMAKQLVAIENLLLNSKVNTAQQNVDAKLTAAITANLANQQTSVNDIKLTALIEDSSLPNGKANIDLTTNLTADMAKQTVSISALALQVYDLLINADVNATNIQSDTPSFAGKLSIDPFNLRQLAKSMSIELPVMADDSTLELVKLNTNFSGSTNSFSAKKLDLTIDQSQLSGNFAINNFTKPGFKFNLVLDEIDADRYLPPVSEQQVAPPATSAAAGAAQLPLEQLRQINAQGTLDIGKLKVSGTNSDTIHLEISAKDGLIKLSPLSANLYQGHYKGDVRLDAKGKTLKLALNENLSGVQAGPLLKDLSGDDNISGVANAQAKLTANGATVEQIKQTLNGNGKFSFTDGAVKGINIAESIRKAKAALKGQSLPESDTPIATDFSALTGSFTAKQGIINNQDLLIMSPLLRVNGAGTADLPKEAINYGLKVAIVGTSKGQQGKDLEELKGLTIPVKITGTFSEPKPSVDLASLLKQKATEEVKAKVADKLQDKLGGELGGLLGGALGSPSSSEQQSAPAEPEPKQEPAPSVEEQAKDMLKDKLKGFF